VPEEYVQTMRESMLKRCPVSSLEQVRGVFKKDIGELPEKVCSLSPFPALLTIFSYIFLKELFSCCTECIPICDGTLLINKTPQSE
jgi:hypothetical protein